MLEAKSQRVGSDHDMDLRAVKPAPACLHASQSHRSDLASDHGGTGTSAAGRPPHWLTCANQPVLPSGSCLASRCGKVHTMTHIHVRKLIEQQTEYAGRQWWYSFTSLPSRFAEQKVGAFSSALSTRLGPVTKAWDTELNSEWVTRIYFAARMVLGASVTAQSLRYATEKNLRPVVPYLEYYTLLHALRAVVFTDLGTPWKNFELLKLTHTKTINVSTSIIAGLDKGLGEEMKHGALQLKAFRELISYRAPSSGDKFKRHDFDVIEWSRLLLELAQMQSELIESWVLKNATGDYELKEEWIKEACTFRTDDIEIHEPEDRYRLGYLARKYPRPTNILHIMSEGHVEDFFGSWTQDEPGDADEFDPDRDQRILFDVP